MVSKLEPINLPEQLKSSIKNPITWWLTPRSLDRDIAFRERIIRAATGILVILGLYSMYLAIFIYKDPWSPVSFPVLNLIALSGLLFSFYTASRQHILLAGYSLAITVAICGGYVILLTREMQSMSVAVYGGPIFMFTPLTAALVLPRNRIIPLSLVASLIFFITQFVLPLDTSVQTTLQLDMVATTISITLLLLFEALLLRQMRVEFDGRLEELSTAVRQTEAARVQAEEARKKAEKAQRDAEAADIAKTQFLANMSHELRTPLNAIIGYDEAMIAGMVGNFTDRQTEILGYIQHNGHRLLSLINDILDLSKIESGSIEAYMEPMSLRPTIKKTITSLDALANQKAISLVLNIDDTLPEMILFDEGKLQQIITNLVSNAIKFTETGSVTVDVDRQAANQWQVVVTDTGVGIPKDKLEEIFEPFKQVDGSATRKYKGTGLGLSITKRLTEKLGGQIMVESSLGEGSQFTLMFPLLMPNPS
ncbi:hypothetical protein G4Y79_05870 [Phototrophicus methaneseepsis]|uniref:Circadian input-output histidine kinase CikA n=1 Tax=Phototrophicus methaneseepsis TaxID=2710758 RepID=A0A7S8EBF7_9CHLR|nr:ATP-binding protein [Phototrophicus methaneseepsis]QPC83905.1 hypothetical protein G4Y79_05870 [Phototrophicus methaneseepsis]